MAEPVFHEPVLLREVLDVLEPRPDDLCVDLTIGGGAHAEAILERLGPRGRLVGFDRDAEAVEAAAKRLERFGKQVSIVHENFANMDKVLQKMGMIPVDVLLFDLGLSSHQVDRPERGFSFNKKGPLDMRMDRRDKVTAGSMLKDMSVTEMARIFKEYGEEPFAGKIARRVVELRERGESPSDTVELAKLIEQTVAKKGGSRRIHPATKSFMALRIAVNRELENLKQALDKAVEVMAPGARIAVISYHSLEDRIVKQFFREREKGCICPPSAPECRCGRKPEIEVITRKPIYPSEGETAANPRSRSARLRAARKLEQNT